MRGLFGCHVSPATLHTTKVRCSTKLVGAEERIKAALRHSEVIGADGTGLRVAGRSGWIHVARTGRLTHYGYDARRGRAATDALGILPGFKGTCVRDGWYAYDGYRQCRHALCGAHLLRELVYVEEVSPDQRQWTQPFIKLLLEIKAAAGRARAAGLGRLGEEVEAKFTRRYDRLVRRGERLNPPLPKEKPDPALPKCKVVRAMRRSPVRSSSGCGSGATRCCGS